MHSGFTSGDLRLNRKLKAAPALLPAAAFLFADGIGL
jgi:hypothetical protein